MPAMQDRSSRHPWVAFRSRLNCLLAALAVAAAAPATAVELQAAHALLLDGGKPPRALPGFGADGAAMTCSAGARPAANCAPLPAAVTAPRLVADDDRVFVGTFDGSGSTCLVDAVCGPSDSECLSPACVGGLCGFVPRSVGTACGNGAGTCDDTGTCLIACAVAASCPGEDSICHTRICDMGFCGSSNALPGTQCIGGLCDAAGNCHVATSCTANLDCGLTGNECTQAICTTGTCAQAPYPFGMTCTGGTCDGNGACIPGGACNLDADCPATGNECTYAECSNHACLAINYPVGYACTGGTCDGMGACKP